MSEVIVRMPPSPTGHLHLGTARTALFNYLFAKKNNGKIVFRWEDTDKERSKTEHETEILEGLKWLGMDFEKESHLFVRQTESLDSHTQRLQELWNDEKVFPCFVTSEEIETQRDFCQKNKQNFVFWSPSRELSREELETEMQSGKPFTWRIKTPRDKIYSFDDMVRGTVTTNSDTIGDFVVARSDGSVLYLLANVFDDEAQSISHIIRGEDHVSNTAKQLILWEALDLKPAHYAHIPLVLDSQKRKLSKRRVDPGVAVLIPDFQELGFLPEAVVNGLAFLGWNPKTTEEVFSFEELQNIFDLKQVNKASAQYDFEKMKWYNQQWNNRLEISDLTARYLAWINEYDNEKTDFYKNIEIKSLESVLTIVRQKSKLFSDFHAELDYFFEAPNIEIIDGLVVNEKMKIDVDLSKKVLSEILTMLEGLDDADFTPEKLKEVSVIKIGEMGLKNGQFLWPFRTALSGREKSAGPFEIGAILGKKACISRVKLAISTFA